jgi:histone H3/H4
LNFSEGEKEKFSEIVERKAIKITKNSNKYLKSRKRKSCGMNQ